MVLGAKLHIRTIDVSYAFLNALIEQLHIKCSNVGSSLNHWKDFCTNYDKAWEISIRH